MRKHVNVINTAVVSLVGVIGIRNQEGGRVIDGWLVVVVRCASGREVEPEEASWILWLDGATDGEVGAHEDTWIPQLMGQGNPMLGRGHGDVWLNQQVCQQRDGWLNIYFLF